jgi:hypothetical protein
VYSLPFKGESNYKQSYSLEQQQKLKEHQKMLATIGMGASSAVIGLS